MEIEQKVWEILYKNKLLFLLFSLYFVNLFCLYLSMFHADLKVPFDITGHIYNILQYTWQLTLYTVLQIDSYVMKTTKQHSLSLLNFWFKLTSCYTVYFSSDMESTQAGILI